MSPVRLIIAGHPRCGSTLLSTLLNQQRGCRFITEYVGWMNTPFNRAGVKWNTPLSKEQRGMCLAVAREEWLRLNHPILVKTDDFRTVDGLHRAISAELLDADVRAVGHLAPLSIPAMEACRSTDIELIVIVRDPRAAALSFRNRVGGGVAVHVQSWKRTVRWARGTTSKITLLRYEDLILEPLETLGKVTRLWGEEPQIPDELLFEHRVGGSGVAWTENSSFGDVSGILDPTPIDRWRRSANAPAVQYANAVCEAEMRWLGYAPLTDQGLRTKARMRLFETYVHIDERADALWRRARKYIHARLDVLDPP